MWHNGRFLNYIAINCYARDKKHSFKTFNYFKENKIYLHCAERYQNFWAMQVAVALICFAITTEPWTDGKYIIFTPNSTNTYILYKIFWTVSQTPNIFFHVLCLKGWRLADEHCTGHRPTRTPTFLGVSRMEFQRLPFSEVPKHYVKKSQLLSIR